MSCATLKVLACASTISETRCEYPPPMLTATGILFFLHASNTILSRSLHPARVIESLPNLSEPKTSTPARYKMISGCTKSINRGVHCEAWSNIDHPQFHRAMVYRDLISSCEVDNCAHHVRSK